MSAVLLLEMREFTWKPLGARTPTGGTHDEERGEGWGASEQNVETVKGMYEALGRGDIDAIVELVTDDVDWSTDAAIESAPWYGPRHGKAGVRSFFEGIVQTRPDHRVHAAELREQRRR